MNEKIQISILVDNNARPDLKKEHGFFVSIEVSGHRILSDTGQGISLMPNAAMLECDLDLAEAVAFMQNELGEKVIQGYAGLVWEQ